MVICNYWEWWWKGYLYTLSGSVIQIIQTEEYSIIVQRNWFVRTPSVEIPHGYVESSETTSPKTNYSASRRSEKTGQQTHNVGCNTPILGPVLLEEPTGKF
jgi:hypothetical protein